MADPSTWTVELDAEQRRLIGRAARRAWDFGAKPEYLNADNFPLPGMEADIADWTQQLASGRAFLLLRGFPLDELTSAETELAFVGLGSHLGRPVGQNKAGDILTHIIDERLPSREIARLYRTNSRQDFHTDGADIIGLLCLQGAQRGGESRVASAGAIHNEIVDRRPDLVEVLREPMPWDRQGEHGDGEQPWFEIAPLADHDGEPRFFYIGWYIRDSQRHPDAPRLTGPQLEAMALVEEIANDPAFHVEMEFRRGDVQLLNNARILHAREAFEDQEDPARRRHLLRLWLAAHEFSSVEDVLRTGLGDNPGDDAGDGGKE